MHSSILAASSFDNSPASRRVSATGVSPSVHPLTRRSVLLNATLRLRTVSRWLPGQWSKRHRPKGSLMNKSQSQSSNAQAHSASQGQPDQATSPAEERSSAAAECGSAARYFDRRQPCRLGTRGTDSSARLSALGGRRSTGRPRRRRLASRGRRPGSGRCRSAAVWFGWQKRRAESYVAKSYVIVPRHAEAEAALALFS
jgi:hypothetical protein